MMILAMRAIANPNTLALFLCASDTLSTNIEMTSILSTPSTNSKPMSNDNNAIESAMVSNRFYRY